MAKPRKQYTEAELATIKTMFLHGATRPEIKKVVGGAQRRIDAEIKKIKMAGNKSTDTPSVNIWRDHSSEKWYCASPEKIREIRVNTKNRMSDRLSMEKYSVGGVYVGKVIPEIFTEDNLAPEDISCAKSFVYVRICKVEGEDFGKIYVGETNNYDKRCKTKDYTSGPFGGVWKKYGAAGFLTLVIPFDDIEFGRKFEQDFIVAFQTRDPKYGWNVR